jgi:hypothetical protein
MLWEPAPKEWHAALSALPARGSNKRIGGKKGCSIVEAQRQVHSYALGRCIRMHYAAEIAAVCNHLIKGT